MKEIFKNMGLSKSESEMIQGGSDCWTCDTKECQYKCVSQCTLVKECVTGSLWGSHVSSDNAIGK